MKLHHAGAEIYVPDGTTSAAAALARTTHLAVGAHQDDLELFAFHGIRECFGRSDQRFFGVTVTDGGGSPRAGRYANHSDDDLKRLRRLEQKRAAMVGDYAGVALLNYGSAAVKDAANPGPTEDLKALIAAAKPKVIYTHNPADKHDTHVAVMLRTLAALRELPAAQQPQAFYGVEVWRDLDWVLDQEKVKFNVSGYDHLAAALLGLYDSQIAGGKRYDLATLGRRRAHATYAESHGVDECDSLIYGLDLLPLLRNPQLTVAEFVGGFLDRTRAEIATRLKKLG